MGVDADGNEYVRLTALGGAATISGTPTVWSYLQKDVPEQVTRIARFLRSWADAIDPPAGDADANA